MDRLIYKEADGDLTCRSRDFEKVFPALYAYEESGLTPDEIKEFIAHHNALTDEILAKLEQVMKERDALAAELKDERHRHDRYVDFELAESEELRKAKKENTVKDLQLHLLADERNIAMKERDRLAELWAQVPATIKTQVIRICEGEFAEDNNVPCKK